MFDVLRIKPTTSQHVFLKVCLEIIVFHTSSTTSQWLTPLNVFLFSVAQCTSNPSLTIIVPFQKTISVIFYWPWEFFWRGIPGGHPPKIRSHWYRSHPIRLATWFVPFVLNSSRCAKAIEWACTTPPVHGWVMAAIWEVTWFKGGFWPSKHTFWD